METIKKAKYPKKQYIINRINGYIQRLEKEGNEGTDTLFILKNILKV